jgi:predicted dehydrogenase
VELSGVADLDAQRAAQVAAEFAVPGAADFRELLPRADAAIVAVPTAAHRSVVEPALEAGLDVLVEKPIATSVPEAEKLLAQARERGRLIQVGHLEWFNAAMRAVVSRLDRPRFVEAHRLGPFPARSTDIDVVRDLMIHDLDIVQRLVGEEPEQIDSIGVPVITDRVDIANARLKFPGGCVANFTASRVSPSPLRKIRFFQPDAYFSLDFVEQNVTIAQRVPSGPGGEREVALQRLEIDREDALLEQLRAFLKGIRSRKVEAGAGGEGLKALRTALRIVEAMPPLDAPT